MKECASAIIPRQGVEEAYVKAKEKITDTATRNVHHTLQIPGMSNVKVTGMSSFKEGKPMTGFTIQGSLKILQSVC